MKTQDEFEGIVGETVYSGPMSNPFSNWTRSPSRFEARVARCSLPRAAVLCALVLAGLGCGVQVYDIGLPSHGTRFTLPPGAAMSADPVTQSWAAYSLAKSTCQLSIGGPRPAANSSFSCEYRSRDVLVERWSTRNEVSSSAPPSPRDRKTDAYLELLETVTEAGFLAEYVWHYLGERDWIEPDWLRLADFEPWRKRNLGWHRPETRIIGYWTNAPDPR